MRIITKSYSGLVSILLWTRGTACWYIHVAHPFSGTYVIIVNRRVAIRCYVEHVQESALKDCLSFSEFSITRS